MIGETLAQGTSVLHRLDPRGKIVGAVFFALAMALSYRFVTLFGGLAVAGGLVLLARLPFREVGRRLLVTNFFVGFFWLLLPFTVAGVPIMAGPLSLSREGLLLAALLTLKANAIVLAFLALLATSSIVTLGHALHSLAVPDKLVYLLLFTYRYIHVIEQEYQRLAQAMLVRGFRPKTNLHTYRSYAYLIGMLLVRSSNRAQRVYEAMLCRGFQGRFHSLYSFTFSRGDFLFGLCMLAAVSMLVYLEWLQTI